MTTPADALPLLYRFADLTLDVANCVTRRGRPIELKSLDFDLLRFLVESAPNVRDIGMVAYWQQYGWPTRFCRRFDEHDFACDL